ncbi:histidine phosphatase family protein [Clostridium hydrogenum]|uniref:histidine phosphatase family protein n=1 Tax=Clostridium hydrogenum TaxID=2855764 RepID=UPI001F3A59C6|nr:histidine phosphatase family protein [Clostridium hydrogenum]
MDIVFIRHGEAEGNTRGVYHGRLDLSLTLEGKKAALKAAELIKTADFDGIYISPLKRTRETAKFLGVKGEIDERLLERNFGVFENLSYREILKNYPKEAEEWERDFVNYKIPKGESLKEVFERTKEFIEEKSQEKDKILVVTHDGVIRCALTSIFNAPEQFFKFKIDYLKLTQITIDEGYSYIKAINSVEIY